MKIKLMVVVLLLSLPMNVCASMFVGYDEFCGLPVLVERTSQGSLADIRQGQRVIIVDPGVMRSWTLSRIFYLAHECAHHMLGHMEWDEQLQRKYFNATRRQELQADCWAAEKLANNGYREDIERTILQHINEGPIMQGPYPSGMERAQFIAQCAGIELPPPGFPSGYGIQVCGCWGYNPTVVAPEPRCQSGYARVNRCIGFCPGGGSPYAYVCQ